jgi:hypothetical protein
MYEYDKSSKWLIQHHGDAILRLAGVDDIASWTPLQAELVQPRQLPDGVLSVLERGQTDPDVYILEIASFPDARVPSQAVRDTALVLLERKILPEVVVLFLHQKGNVPAADSIELQSRKGFTKLNLSWRAVKLWELPAEDLLAVGDVGLIPWVPLAHFQGPPEPIVSRCRAQIDRVTAHPEHENLLAVNQILLKLRYNDQTLLERLRDMLGGRQAMIESPIYQDLIDEARQQDILDVLESRFGPAARDLEVELKAVEFDRLRDLVKFCGTCNSLEAFREHLRS